MVAAAPAHCGLDEVADALMGRPIMVATRAFDFLLNQADYLHAEQDLRVLLDHLGSTIVHCPRWRRVCSTQRVESPGDAR